MTIQGKKIVLGITGGIAAYKTPELVRQLTGAGAEVSVVMSRAAHHFVTVTSLQAVSGRAVRDDLWDRSAEAAMGHIELARWADCILIAPVTAHSCARLAQGEADDLLSTLCLAAPCPIAIAPAMNQQMWQHPAVQRNITQLRSDGVHVWGPGVGDQACGDVGPGRMLEPEVLVNEVAALFGTQRLKGARVLITAGPTREPLDPVRFISNHSSGKQGFALAEAALGAGAEVTLVSGPVAITTPPGAIRVDVTTALEMHDCVMARVANHDVFIGVAAVADFRPDSACAEKIKKTSGRNTLSLDLVENPDIIAAVASLPDRPLAIGFAAETERALENARDKLARKGLDLIVVNDVSDQRIGFDSDDNEVTLIALDTEQTVPRANKRVVSRVIIERIADLYEQRSSAR
jgi:phosphopantothenoylcysteine decarboxylase/phosphopantothenate--cysteine ligase